MASLEIQFLCLIQVETVLKLAYIDFILNIKND